MLGLARLRSDVKPADAEKVMARDPLFRGRVSFTVAPVGVVFGTPRDPTVTLRWKWIPTWMWLLSAVTAIAACGTLNHELPLWVGLAARSGYRCRP